MMIMTRHVLNQNVVYFILSKKNETKIIIMARTWQQTTSWIGISGNMLRKG